MISESMSAGARRGLGHWITDNFWAFFGSIWLIVGLPFLLIAGYLIVQERQLASAGRVVEGVVLAKHITRSKDTVTRSVTYRFEAADGRRIEGDSDVPESLWRSLTERGPVQVLYLPDRPSANRIAGTSKMTLLLIFSFVGGLLSIAGATIAGVALRNARVRRRLLTSGVRAPATIAEVKPMNLRINGRTQWRLTYEYRDHQNRPHRRSMHVDADEARRWQPGNTGDVMFDPERPRHAIWLGNIEAAS